MITLDKSSLLTRVAILFATIIASIIGGLIVSLIVTSLCGLSSHAKLMTTQFCQVIAMIVGGILYLRIVGEKPRTVFKFNKPLNIYMLFIAIVFAICIIPTIDYISSFAEDNTFPSWVSERIRNYLFQQARESLTTTNELVGTSTYLGLAVNIVVVALGAAFSEEMLFRGIIMGGLSKRFNHHAAIWLTALLFSACHFSVYGIIARTLHGAIYGYMVYYSKSLWTSIAAHTMNNAIVIGIIFFSARSQTIANFDTTSTPLCIASVIICSGLFILMKLLHQKSKAENTY